MNNPNYVILKSKLKVFALLVVKFEYNQINTVQDMYGFTMKFSNFKQEVYFKMRNVNNKDHILVFIKDILSQNVYILWSVQKKRNN